MRLGVFVTDKAVNALCSTLLLAKLHQSVL